MGMSGGVEKVSECLFIEERLCISVVYLAKSSLSSLTSSCAVHWSDRLVNPQMSANKMLQVNKVSQ